MSEHKPESRSSNEALSDEIMSSSREVFIIARNWLFKDTAGTGRMGVEKTPQAEALDDVLGAFVLNNIDDLDNIHTLPLTPEVEEAKKEYIDMVVIRGLDWAVYDQVTKNYEREITEKLQGRTITLRSLKGGLGIGNTRGLTSSPAGPFEATGPFLSYDAGLSTLRIGETKHYYETQLWRQNYLAADHPIEQHATLRIHD